MEKGKAMMIKEELLKKVVYDQWLQGGKEIKENGIEAFWKKNVKKPHYAAYKEEMIHKK